MNTTLCLHTGGQGATREQVNAVKTPEPSNNHVPLPHGKFIDIVLKELDDCGLKVLDHTHALNRDGQQYFGLAQVELQDVRSDAWGTIIGFRNAHDRRFPASLALGSRVFVCDNLAFNGEVVLKRRHTRYIERDLPSITARAISQLVECAKIIADREKIYRESGIGQTEAHDLVIRSLDAGAITTTMVPKVLSQWRNPDHPEFKDRNAWSLYNAFTEVFKTSSLAALPNRSSALHAVLDGHVKFGFN